MMEVFHKIKQMSDGHCLVIRDLSNQELDYLQKHIAATAVSHAQKHNLDLFSVKINLKVELWTQAESRLPVMKTYEMNVPVPVSTSSTQTDTSKTESDPPKRNWDYNSNVQTSG